jgi:plasmid rolling circle replication initiator protein Rep
MKQIRRIIADFNCRKKTQLEYRVIAVKKQARRKEEKFATENTEDAEKLRFNSHEKAQKAQKAREEIEANKYFSLQKSLITQKNYKIVLQRF